MAAEEGGTRGPSAPRAVVVECPPIGRPEPPPRAHVARVRVSRGRAKEAVTVTAPANDFSTAVTLGGQIPGLGRAPPFGRPRAKEHHVTPRDIRPLPGVRWHTFVRCSCAKADTVQKYRPSYRVTGVPCRVTSSYPQAPIQELACPWSTRCSVQAGQRWVLVGRT